jgi:hypothetical protein
MAMTGDFFRGELAHVRGRFLAFNILTLPEKIPEKQEIETVCGTVANCVY